MARLITFFPKQMYAAEASAVDLYSPVFDVTEYSQIVAELLIYDLSSWLLSITGIIEESSASCLDPRSWSALAYETTNGDPIKIIASDPLRFVRAKVIIPSGVTTIFSFEAEARENH